MTVKSRSLTISSNFDDLEALGEFTDSLAEEAGLSQARAYHLRLATDELATNVIVHGYGPARPGRLVIEGGTDGESVWVRLADSAPRFDPHVEGPEVDVGQPLTHRQPGGLGLHLVRSIANSFRWEYADGMNRQTLVFREQLPEPTTLAQAEPAP